MFNPLLGNLSELKEAEVENKISELTKKYFMALRSNGYLAEQVLVSLEAYKYELRQRQVASQKTLAEKSNKDLDDLIKVD
jgi:argininosuccinate lyase